MSRPSTGSLTSGQRAAARASTGGLAQLALVGRVAQASNAFKSMGARRSHDGGGRGNGGNGDGNGDGGGGGGVNGGAVQFVNPFYPELESAWCQPNP
jgi:hypothetical protein